MKICMIGAGMMANKVHYPSLASFDDVEIAGICDLNEQRVARTADQYGIRNRYTDYRKMLDGQKPDGVYVIMPPQYMYDIVCDCLRSGLNTFTEKPLGMSLHQAETLTRLAEEKRRDHTGRPPETEQPNPQCHAGQMQGTRRSEPCSRRVL